MNFIDLAKQRYSCRSYKQTPVEKEKLDMILEAGRIAPTAKNNQPQRIYVLQSEEALNQIRSITSCAFNAPIVLMIAYNAEEEWTNPLEEGIHSGVEDASIVAAHMMLEASELNLATCWVNRFPNSETAKAFSLPENLKPVLLMPLGYPADKPSPRHFERKDTDEIVQYL